MESHNSWKTVNLEMWCSNQRLGNKKITVIFNEFSVAIASYQKFWFSRPSTSMFQKIMREAASFSGIWGRGRGKRKRKCIPVVKAWDEKSSAPSLLCCLYSTCKSCEEEREILRTESFGFLFTGYWTFLSLILFDINVNLETRQTNFLLASQSQWISSLISIWEYWYWKTNSFAWLVSTPSHLLNTPGELHVAFHSVVACAIMPHWACKSTQNPHKARMFVTILTTRLKLHHCVQLNLHCFSPQSIARDGFLGWFPKTLLQEQWR